MIKIVLEADSQKKEEIFRLMFKEQRKKSSNDQWHESALIIDTIDKKD